MLNWPSTLPQQLDFNGYSAMAKPNAVSDSPEIGEPLVRARFTGEVDDISGKLILDGEQLRTLDEFWRYGLKSGSLPFRWDHPENGLAAEAHFLGRPPRRQAVGPNLFDVELSIQFIT